jgi:hypothetical protein
VSVVVTPFKIPSNLRHFLDEARQCYGLGQFAAVQSLSRTILEVAVNDIAVRIGRMPRKFTEGAMSKRIRWVSGNQSKQIYAHYRELCTVVHGQATCAVDGPLGSLTKTIGYVEYLYDLNKDQIRD